MFVILQIDLNHYLKRLKIKVSSVTLVLKQNIVYTERQETEQWNVHLLLVKQIFIFRRMSAYLPYCFSNATTKCFMGPEKEKLPAVNETMLYFVTEIHAKRLLLHVEKYN